MGICALIEAVLLGVWWYVMPPSHPGWLVAEFGCGFLFALALMAGLRVKGFEKLTQLMLLMVPATVGMVSGMAIMTHSAGGSARSAAAYVCVFFFGVFLMVSAAPTRRRQRG